MPCYGATSYDHYGQHYSGVLYQQTGWDPFSHPVTSSSGSNLFLWLQSQDITIWARHMWLQDMWHSDNGHVCHSPQHPFFPVYVSDSGASSTGDRCSVTGLAPFSQLNKVNLSILLGPTVITGYVSNRKLYHPHTWWLSCSTTKQQYFQTECMMRGGFASLTGPQEKELIRLVQQLLKYLFDTHGRSPQTIKGYRSCLASVLSFTGNAAKSYHQKPEINSVL